MNSGKMHLGKKKKFIWKTNDRILEKKLKFGKSK